MSTDELIPRLECLAVAEVEISRAAGVDLLSIEPATVRARVLRFLMSLDEAALTGTVNPSLGGERSGVVWRRCGGEGDDETTAGANEWIAWITVSSFGFGVKLEILRLKHESSF